ncbi:helix-turn-helix domain-containing protein [Candidatus Micrarchaeota archaeon]|nr:helix-turn-helix domain-containing protein [Candidatus Micrarchaeota archaeon]
MQRSGLIIELEQVHDCCSVAVTQKNKDSKLKWIATVGENHKYIMNLFELTSPEPKKFIEHLRTHKDVGAVKVISIAGEKAHITVHSKKVVSTSQYLTKSGTAWIEPTWSENGVDHVTMLAPDFASFKKFLSSVEDKYDIKIKSKRYLDDSTKLSLDTFRSSGFLQLKMASELLTDKQLSVFEMAAKYGYYENPKKITLLELAQKIDSSEAAVSELLRKAEKKLMPILSEIIRMMR